MLLILNLNTNVMLEAKYTWNATKISMLQQKFENFCKIPSWCLYLWFNSFYFVTINSTFDTASLCFFFIDKFIDKQQHFLYLMKVLIVLIPCVKAWQIHFVRIISLNKLHHNKASQIDVFTNKLDNLGNTTIIWVFWLIFILNQSYHQTHIAD